MEARPAIRAITVLSQMFARYILVRIIAGGMDLSVVNEIDSTGSILDVSDLSFDATCDPTLDESKTRSFSDRGSVAVMWIRIDRIRIRNTGKSEFMDIF